MVIARNKKAFHDYFIDETFEAGIVLFGPEIKSIRKSEINIKESYVRIKDNEAYLINAHINPFLEGNMFNKEPLRERKLLLHKKEIKKLESFVSRDGFTLIPTKVYITRGLVKIEIGVGRGKKNYDKRHSLKEKDMKRSLDKILKNY